MSKISWVTQFAKRLLFPSLNTSLHFDKEGYSDLHRDTTQSRALLTITVKFKSDVRETNRTAHRHLHTKDMTAYTEVWGGVKGWFTQKQKSCH